VQPERVRGFKSHPLRQNMIPLVSIAKFIALILMIAADYGVFLSWRKNKESESFGYFFKFFIFSTITIFLFILPPIVGDPQVIQLIIDAIYIFALISTAYFLLLVLELTGRREYKKAALKVFTFLTILLLILFFTFFKGATVYNYQFMGANFGWWLANFPIFLKIFYCLFLMVVITFFSAILFMHGLNFRDLYLKKRSVSLNLGFILIGTAAFSYFFIDTIFTFLNPNFFLDLLHCFITIVAAVVICTAVFYKGPKNESSEKETVINFK
jgi:hypothetical protein